MRGCCSPYSPETFRERTMSPICHYEERSDVVIRFPLPQYEFAENLLPSYCFLRGVRIATTVTSVTVSQ